MVSLLTVQPSLRPWTRQLRLTSGLIRLLIDNFEPRCQLIKEWVDDNAIAGFNPPPFDPDHNHADPFS